MNRVDVAVERTTVNPVAWSAEMGKPQHAGDMAAQLALSLENLGAVLGEAGMSLANLIRLNASGRPAGGGTSSR